MRKKLLVFFIVPVFTKKQEEDFKKMYLEYTSQIYNTLAYDITKEWEEVGEQHG